MASSLSVMTQPIWSFSRRAFVTFSPTLMSMGMRSLV